MEAGRTGRPTKPAAQRFRTFSVSFPPGMLRRIDRETKAEGLHRSQWIRRLVERHLRALDEAAQSVAQAG